jgi:hypothetical protein
MQQNGIVEESKTFHYLIVDDSEIIRTQFGRAISEACVEMGGSHHAYQVMRNGQVLEQPQSVLPPGNPSQSGLTYHVYTAPTFKLALRVLDFPFLEKLTIISDLSIPADTEVGLLGMLEALARRKLPVNLIFVSSEYQNRAMIEPLLRKGKAYFVEKGMPQWDALPLALVQRVTSFHYQQISFNDFSTISRPTNAPTFLDKMAQAAPPPQPNITPRAGTSGALPAQPANPRAGMTGALPAQPPNPRAGTSGALPAQPANPRAGTSGALPAQPANPRAGTSGALPAQPINPRAGTSGALPAQQANTLRPAGPNPAQPTPPTTPARAGATGALPAQPANPRAGMTGALPASKSRSGSTGDLSPQRLRSFRMGVTNKLSTQRPKATRTGTTDPLAANAVSAHPLSPDQADANHKSGIVGNLVNSVREFPGRAGALGSNTLREIPQLIRNLPRPGRRKEMDKPNQ